MLVTAACSECSHEFQVDSAYVGTKRKCPSCGEKFMFEEPVAGSEQQSTSPIVTGSPVASGMGATPPKQEQMTCPGCRRSKNYIVQEQVMCFFCGTRFSPEAGAQQEEFDAAAEDTMWEMIMNGEWHDNILAAFEDMGMSPEEAEGFLETNMMRVPFRRAEAVFEDGAYAVRMQNCDICGAEIENAQSAPMYRIHWTHVERDNENAAVGMAVAGLVGAAIGAAMSKTHRRDMIGLHSLCKPCRKSMTKMFGGYKGYPVSDKFSVSSCKDYHPEGEGSTPT